MNVNKITVILTLLLLLLPAGRITYSGGIENENFINESNAGKTLYVGGNGPGNYTSIQAAINAAEDGDTIFVYSGTYYENVVVKKSVTIVGENKNTTIIDGRRKNDVIFLNASEATISNFTIQNGTTGWTSGGIHIRGRGNKISENIIKNNNDGVLVESIDSFHNEIEKNIIFNNKEEGVDLFNADKNIVRENIVFDNRGDGIDVSDASGNIIEKNILDDTIYLGRAYENTVKNNSFTEGGIKIWWSSDNKILDNTINGKPIIFLKNKKNMEIREGAQIILEGCEGIKIKNLHISNTYAAIHLSNCKRCIIEKNILENNVMGIEIYNSQGIFMINNKISDSKLIGIFISDSIIDVIRKNSFENNRWGLWISFSKINFILKNNFENSECGINMTISLMNAILKNNFIENSMDEYFIFAPLTLWLRNYWDTWRLPLPKPLHGMGLDLEPRLQFDWMPRLFPYGGKR